MADWDVYLEYKDAKSNKFWRARTEGGELTINYGRIGTDGQTKVKDLGDAASAKAEMDKVAGSKRRKGYDDADGGAAPEAKKEEVVIAPVALDKPQAAKLKLDAGGRKVALELARDGDKIKTVVVETYKNAEEAAAAFGRIEAAMKSDGYR
jgi:predicted DNA-binding WGR domain protein